VEPSRFLIWTRLFGLLPAVDNDFNRRVSGSLNTSRLPGALLKLEGYIDHNRLAVVLQGWNSRTPSNRESAIQKHSFERCQALETTQPGESEFPLSMRVSREGTYDCHLHRCLPAYASLMHRIRSLLNGRRAAPFTFWSQRRPKSSMCANGEEPWRIGDSQHMAVGQLGTG